ncbi:hypothetical protein C8R45DRAFT_987394 [Mycena sanguinolenta]|nr:hypothetical protein C8R45DRAFT_987394 [Mycena sanguinolenta]
MDSFSWSPVELLRMAPTLGASFVLPPVGPYPTFTRLPQPISSSPTPTPSPSPASFYGTGVNSSAPLSTVIVDIILFIGIIAAILGTGAIVWFCFRRRMRAQRGLENAPEMIEAAKMGTGSQPKFWVIATSQTKTNEALLSDVPNIWRILGRPNVGSEPDYGEAIYDYRKPDQ